MNPYKAIAEQTGSLFDRKPTGRWYVIEDGKHETFKALAFCDAEGRTLFFDSKEAADAAIADHATRLAAHAFNAAESAKWVQARKRIEKEYPQPKQPRGGPKPGTSNGIF